MKKIDETLQRAIDTWGVEKQVGMINEEATELALAARKWLRDPSPKRLKEMSMEVADMGIMIKQYSKMFPDQELVVNETIIEKIERLEMRLDKKDFEAI